MKWIDSAKYYDSGVTKLFNCITCDTQSLDESVELSFEDSYEEAYSSDDDRDQEYDEQQSEEEQTIQEMLPNAVEKVRNMMISKEKTKESKKYEEFEELLQLIDPVDEFYRISKLEENENYSSDLKRHTMKKSSSSDLAAYDDAREEEEDGESEDYKLNEKNTDSSADDESSFNKLEYLQTVDVTSHSLSEESNSTRNNEESFVSLFLQDETTLKLDEQEDDVETPKTPKEDELTSPLPSKEGNSLITDMKSDFFFVEDKRTLKLDKQEDDVETPKEDEFAPPLSSKEHSSLITNMESDSLFLAYETTLKSDEQEDDVEAPKEDEFASPLPSKEDSSLITDIESDSLFLEYETTLKSDEQEDDVEAQKEDEFASPLPSKEDSSLITDMENVVLHSLSEETNYWSVLSAVELCMDQSRLCTSTDRGEEGKEDECSIRHSEVSEDTKGVVGEDREVEGRDDECSIRHSEESEATKDVVGPLLTIVNQQESQVKVDHETKEKESKSPLRASKRIDTLSHFTDPNNQLCKNNKPVPTNPNKETISNKSYKSRRSELYLLGKNRQLAKREMAKKQQQQTSSSYSSSSKNRNAKKHDVTIEAGNRLYSQSVEKQRLGKERREKIRKMREAAKVTETEWYPSLHPAPFVAKPWDAKKYKNFN